MPVKPNSRTEEENLVRKTYFMELRALVIRTTGQDPDERYSGLLDVSKVHKHLDGGQDFRGTIHQALWPKIVKFAAQNRVSPCGLVRAVFAFHDLDKPPDPHLFYTPYAIDVHEQYVSGFRQMVHVQHKVQQYAFDREVWRTRKCNPQMSTQEVWSEVLTSPTLQCDALFRYYKACNLGMTQLAHSSRARAMQQYLLMPGIYNEVLGNDLPQEFRQAVEEQHQRILAES